ncbi:MAG: glycine hydroxymethyltransferase, partial [Pseudomonadota bacterium]|nr:glycine hydroxymethyltransferase [Pseudomonadota bacterium]
MFSYRQQTLKSVDPDLWAVVQQEHQRQEQHIELIASENYTSPAVLAAQG